MTMGLWKNHRPAADPVHAVSTIPAATGAEAVRAGNAAGLRVQELAGDQTAVWDAFVDGCASGLPQHLSGWRDVLANTYDYETCFLVAHDGEPGARAVRGVMPLFLVAAPLLGKQWRTTPGGLCAADGEAAAALLQRAREIAQATGNARLVLHDSRTAYGGFSTNTLHESRIIDLRGGADAVWRGLDRNVRRQVRMAAGNGLEFIVDRAGARLGDFYAVFSRFAHQVGTPVFGLDFLERILAAFPGRVHLVVSYHQGRPVGGYFQLARGDALYGLWGATLPEALALRAVYGAYWAILADAIAQGYAALDMGRSPSGSNAAKSKAQWGGVAQPVYQQVWRPDGRQDATVRAAPGDVSTLAQTDARFRVFRAVWPKLPYRVSLWLGPAVRRQVPFG